MPRTSLKVVTVVIANNAATSSAFESYGYRVAAIEIPSAWTAADITFTADIDGNGTYLTVVDNSGAAIKCSGIATSVAEVLIPPELADRLTSPYLKLRSTNTSSEADVNQGAERTIKILLEAIDR